MSVLMTGHRGESGAMEIYEMKCKNQEIKGFLKGLEKNRARESFTRTKSGQKEDQKEEGSESELEGGHLPLREQPKTPDQLAMENETKDLLNAVIAGVIKYIAERHAKEGINFKAKTQDKAQVLAEGKVDQWIEGKLKAKSIKRGIGSEEELDATQKVLVFLKKKYLSELGDEVFEELQESKLRK
jgi:hypothetical protein